ncbi:TVP38/TMEM64 family protein, partial [Microcoleus anatoxicus PTRS2]
MPQPQNPNYPRNIFQRKFLFLSIALSLSLLIIATKSSYIQDFLRTVLIQIQDLGWWGPVAFVATYNIATILFIPGAVLTLGG